jgi:hypothetical protein
MGGDRLRGLHRVGDAIAGQHVRCQHGRMLRLLGNFAVFKRMTNGQIVEVVPVDDACEGPKDALCTGAWPPPFRRSCVSIPPRPLRT